MSRKLSCSALSIALLFPFFLSVPRGRGQVPRMDGTVSRNEEPTRGTFTLGGTVVNSVTGEPIRRALVQIFMSPQQAVLTDVDGKFEFNSLPRGQTNVAARKPGFLSQQEVSPGQSANMVETGPDAKPVIVKLVPEGVLFGRLDSKGEAIEDLPVKVIALRIAEGRKHWEVRGRTMTDEDGAFRIAGLAPGTYYIAAGPSLRRSSFGSRSKSGRDGYAEGFYPAASDISGAMPVEVSAGQQVEADFSLKPVPIFDISGALTGIEPGLGAGLELVNDSEVASLGMRFDAESGEFQTMAPAGLYHLQAWSRGQDGETLTASVPINVTSDLSGIRLVLAAPISIPIHVKLEQLAPENPGAGRFVFRRSDNFAPVNVRLLATELSLRNHEVGMTRIPKPGSPPELLLRDIEPGKYFADVEPNLPWYVYSAHCGGANLLTGDLQLATGVQPEPIEIVLRDDAATMSTKVSSQGQLTQGFVLVIPDGAPRRTKSMFVPDGAELEMSGLAPGEYSVLALDRVDGLEYTNPEVLSRYLSNASHLVLEANQKIELNLELTRVHE